MQVNRSSSSQTPSFPPPPKEHSKIYFISQDVLQFFRRVLYRLTHLFDRVKVHEEEPPPKIETITKEIFPQKRRMSLPAEFERAEAKKFEGEKMASDVPVAVPKEVAPVVPVEVPKKVVQVTDNKQLKSELLKILDKQEALLAAVNDSWFPSQEQFVQMAANFQALAEKGKSLTALEPLCKRAETANQDLQEIIQNGIMAGIGKLLKGSSKTQEMQKGFDFCKEWRQALSKL